MAKTIPRRLALPPFDRPLLDWFAQDYDHVFIAFNPFFRVPGYSPATAAYGPIHAEQTDFDDFEELLEDPPERDNEAPDNFEELIKTIGEPVRWSEVQKHIGASDFNEFARSAWLWTLEAKRPDKSKKIAKALDALADEGLYRPEEDSLPVIMEPLIHRYLTALDVDAVTIWSEFRDHSTRVPSQAFAKGEPPLRLEEHFVAAISSDHPKFLIAWHHDGVEAFIAMTDDTRCAAPPELFFEGRYASVDTYVDWLNPHDFFPRGGGRVN